MIKSYCQFENLIILETGLGLEQVELLRVFFFICPSLYAGQLALYFNQVTKLESVLMRLRKKKPITNNGGKLTPGQYTQFVCTFKMNVLAKE